MEIAASESAATIKNRDLNTVTNTTVKLTRVLQCSIWNHQKRRGEQNRKHHYNTIIQPRSIIRLHLKQNTLKNAKWNLKWHRET